MGENKKETKKWFNALGRSTPFGGTKFGLIRSISNPVENVKPQFSLKAYSEAEKKGHVKSAKEFFGETNNWNETGYITTDGTKLDFSGRHEGAPGGQAGRGGRRGAVVALQVRNHLFQFTPPPRGGRRPSGWWSDRPCNFNPPPRKGGDHGGAAPQRRSPPYFNPRPPREGGDQTSGVCCMKLLNFNPRPPARGRQANGTTYDLVWVFQSAPPARGGDHPARRNRRGPLWTFQSTPPARGGDLRTIFNAVTHNISIHAPPRGGATMKVSTSPTRSRFQSTPPARGATGKRRDRRHADRYFNPRPPRGGRPCDFVRS